MLAFDFRLMDIIKSLMTSAAICIIVDICFYLKFKQDVLYLLSLV